MSLAPEIRAYLEAGAAAGLPQVWEVPIEVIRGNRQSQLAFSGPVEKVKEVVNKFILGLLLIFLFASIDQQQMPRPQRLSIFMVAVGY